MKMIVKDERSKTKGG